MGKTFKQWRQCSSKERYEDEHRAQRVADKCMEKRPGVELRVYDCMDCNGWHISSKPFIEREPKRRQNVPTIDEEMDDPRRGQAAAFNKGASW